MRLFFAPVLLVALVGGQAAAQDQPDELPPSPEPVPDSPPEEPPPDPVPLPSPPPDPEPEGPPPQPVGPAAEDFGQFGTTHRAHTGLLLRGYTGVGFMGTSVDAGGVETAVGGLATSLGLSAGYSLRPRLAVHFDIVFNLMPNAPVTIDGVELDPPMDATGGVFAVGPGASYYLPPKVNAYLAGSVVIFDRFLNQNDMAFANTKAGIGVNGVFGKEWWVGGNLGLGLVGQVFFGNTKETDRDVTWTTLVFTLNFSVTFN